MLQTTFIYKLKLSQKIFLFSTSFLICIITIGLSIYKPIWLFSLFVGWFSYIILMIASFKSMRSKIAQKIIQAQTEQNIEQYTLTYDKEYSEQDNTTSKKPQENKKILKFLDLSKISLGFEMSFSKLRMFAFMLMLLGFVILIWLNVFYPLTYILGVFCGSMCVICYLFLSSTAQ
ncbi:hypothetical protein CQA53_08325 [Helicobacter didelphidarum]|uniref:Uncharacterized protein n=1 Tax=Helicobacter didelphidarum TaxID=2040648 RepID=A0A3D8IFS9_9HELI|nr:hypothetical protein [Helicobacter didelphidarum]RDU63564.1 hypothetical protein CQA53_08325 [Helicobacter didelphidarum]